MYNYLTNKIKKINFIELETLIKKGIQDKSLSPYDINDIYIQSIKNRDTEFNILFFDKIQPNIYLNNFDIIIDIISKNHNLLEYIMTDENIVSKMNNLNKDNFLLITAIKENKKSFDILYEKLELKQHYNLLYSTIRLGYIDIANRIIDDGLIDYSLELNIALNSSSQYGYLDLFIKLFQLNIKDKKEFLLNESLKLAINNGKDEITNYIAINGRDYINFNNNNNLILISKLDISIVKIFFKNTVFRNNLMMKYPDLYKQLIKLRVENF